MSGFVEGELYPSNGSVLIGGVGGRAVLEGPLLE